jgi:23S rRNA (pseudouridine1915-N3)-methyltransferase
MANVTVVTVGTLKEGYLREAVAEYKKRLSQYAKVEEIEIKEERINNEDNRSEIENALTKEAEKILVKGHRHFEGFCQSCRHLAPGKRY